MMYRCQRIHRDAIIVVCDIVTKDILPLTIYAGSKIIKIVDY